MHLNNAGVWRPYNPNPCGKSVGDCAVRATAAALGAGWHEAYDLLCAEGRRQCDMPSGNATWGDVLRANGFRRQVIPNNCPDCYTAGDFALDHPRGLYVLGFGNHVATVRDGLIFDSWNSLAEVPTYYFYRD